MSDADSTRTGGDTAAAFTGLGGKGHVNDLQESCPLLILGCLQAA